MAFPFAFLLACLFVCFFKQALSHGYVFVMCALIFSTVAQKSLIVVVFIRFLICEHKIHYVWYMSLSLSMKMS